MKILLLTIFAISSLLSSDIGQLKAQILSTIAHALIDKDSLNVCLDDKDLESPKKYAKSLKFVSCSKADIVFTSKTKDINMKCKTGLVFATSYYLYRHSPMVVGAFFWQKGRPNIIFRKKQLEKLGIKLPREFSKYVE